MSEAEISKTFLKGLSLLRVFEAGPAARSMADLARGTGYDRATVRRLCHTLVAAGWMEAEGRAYRLAPRVLALAGGYLRAGDFGFSVQPVLNRCAADLGAEVALAVRDGDRALYVGMSSAGEARVSLGLTVGSTLPLMPTALGRVLLAGIEPEARAQVIAGLERRAHTPETQVDPGALGPAVAEVAAAGQAVVRGEYEAGVRGVAVPVGPASDARFALGTNMAEGPDADTRTERALSVLRLAASSLARVAAL